MCACDRWSGGEEVLIFMCETCSACDRVVLICMCEICSARDRWTCDNRQESVVVATYGHNEQCSQNCNVSTDIVSVSL